ncbi:MAG: hypothetical protein PVG24_03045 [Gammaproteobacteria bacterium]|jgi:hypothetical protein
MRLKSIFGVLILVALLAVTYVSRAQREMTVRQGPETVFDVPVEQLLPVLSGAVATDVNGRVGSEFVFWGYRLADGTQAWLYACAIIEGVDCLQRRDAVCEGPVEVIAERTESGRAVDRHCRSIAVAGIGELHPGCNDEVYEAALDIGVVACL